MTRKDSRSSHNGRPLFFVFSQTATNYLTFALNRFKTSQIPVSTVFGTPTWSSARGLYMCIRAPGPMIRPCTHCTCSMLKLTHPFFKTKSPVIYTYFNSKTYQFWSHQDAQRIHSVRFGAPFGAGQMRTKCCTVSSSHRKISVSIPVLSCRQQVPKSLFFLRPTSIG